MISVGRLVVSARAARIVVAEPQIGPVVSSQISDADGAKPRVETRRAVVTEHRRDPTILVTETEPVAVPVFRLVDIDSRVADVLGIPIANRHRGDDVEPCVAVDIDELDVPVFRRVEEAGDELGRSVRQHAALIH